MVLSVVVLPAPFRPEQRHDLAPANSIVTAVERVDVARRSVDVLSASIGSPPFTGAAAGVAIGSSCGARPEVRPIPSGSDAPRPGCPGDLLPWLETVTRS